MNKLRVLFASIIAVSEQGRNPSHGNLTCHTFAGSHVSFDHHFAAALQFYPALHTMRKQPGEAVVLFGENVGCSAEWQASGECRVVENLVQYDTIPESLNKLE